MSLSRDTASAVRLPPAIARSLDADSRAEQMEARIDAACKACKSGHRDAAKYGLYHRELVDLIASQDEDTAKSMMREVLDDSGLAAGSAKAQLAIRRGYQRHATALAKEAGLDDNVFGNARELLAYAKELRHTEGLSTRVRLFNTAATPLSSAINQQERVYDKLTSMKVGLGTDLSALSADEAFDLSHLTDRQRESVANLPVTAPVNGGTWYDGSGTRYQSIPHERDSAEYHEAYVKVFKKEPPKYITAEEVKTAQAKSSIRLAMARYKDNPSSVQDYVKKNIYLAQFEPDKAPPLYREVVEEQYSSGQRKRPDPGFKNTGPLNNGAYHFERYETLGVNGIPHGSEEQKFFQSYGFMHEAETSRLNMEASPGWNQHVKVGIALIAENIREKKNPGELERLKARVDSGPAYRQLFTNEEYGKLFSSEPASDLAEGPGPVERERQKIEALVTKAEYTRARVELATLASSFEPEAVKQSDTHNRALHLRPIAALEKIATQVPILDLDPETAEIKKAFSNNLSSHIQKRKDTVSAAVDLLEFSLSQFGAQPKDGPTAVEIAGKVTPIVILRDEEKLLIEANIAHATREQFSIPGVDVESMSSDEFRKAKRDAVAFLYSLHERVEAERLAELEKLNELVMPKL